MTWEMMWFMEREDTGGHTRLAANPKMRVMNHLNRSFYSSVGEAEESVREWARASTATVELGNLIAWEGSGDVVKKYIIKGSYTTPPPWSNTYPIAILIRKRSRVPIGYEVAVIGKHKERAKLKRVIAPHLPDGWTSQIDVYRELDGSIKYQYQAVLFRPDYIDDTLEEVGCVTWVGSLDEANPPQEIIEQIERIKNGNSDLYC